MTKSKVRQFLDAECGKVLDKLKAIPAVDIPNVGKSLDTVATYIDGRKATIRVIVESNLPEHVTTIIQCFMPMKGIGGWIGVKHAWVDGFRRYADGRTEELESSKLHDYD